MWATFATKAQKHLYIKFVCKFVLDFPIPASQANPYLKFMNWLRLQESINLRKTCSILHVRLLDLVLWQQLPTYFDNFTTIENNWQVHVKIDMTLLAIFHIVYERIWFLVKSILCRTFECMNSGSQRELYVSHWSLAILTYWMMNSRSQCGLYVSHWSLAILTYWMMNSRSQCGLYVSHWSLAILTYWMMNSRSQCGLYVSHWSLAILTYCMMNSRSQCGLYVSHWSLAPPLYHFHQMFACGLCASSGTKWNSSPKMKWKYTCAI